MITRLGVQNFLSLRDINLELGKLTVLVGLNASGKSNVAKVFKLVLNTAHTGVPVLSEYRELESLSFNFSKLINIRLSIEARLRSGVYTYSLELLRDRYVEKIFRDYREVITHDSTANMMSFMGRAVPLGYMPQSYYGFGASTSIIGILCSADENLCELENMLKNIAVHSFTPSGIRLRSNVADRPVIGYHGENLARYLLHLYLERRKDYINIENSMRSAIPEIEEIIPHIEGDKVEIWIRAKNVGEPLRPPNISDGTLRILAITAVLYGGFSLVVLEEPENRVHPYLLGSIVQLARDSPSQVMITTHSPHMLDYVEPEELRLVWKEGLETRVRKLREEELEAVKRYLEEGGTLGEAWYSRIFGD